MSEAPWSPIEMPAPNPTRSGSGGSGPGGSAATQEDEGRHKPPDLDAGPALRAIAMPADANPNGDIFGGWLLSQMDLAGGAAAAQRAGGRIATVGVEAMKFLRPVLIGDEVSCYAAVERTGRTSVRVRVDAWVRRRQTGEAFRVTEGVFTYVAIGPDRRPRELPVE